MKSLTDDLPVSANKLSELRKVVIMQENISSSHGKVKAEDDFDIPLLSEVNSLTSENDLRAIEKKIKNVKNRLGLLVESGSEDEDFINIKAEPDDLFPNEKTSHENLLKTIENKVQKNMTANNARSLTPPLVENDSREKTTKKVKTTNYNCDRNKMKHARITFENEEHSRNFKKGSVLDRLGKRPGSGGKGERSSPKRTRESLNENRITSTKLDEEKRLDEKISGMRQSIIDNMRKKSEAKLKASVEDARERINSKGVCCNI